MALHFDLNTLINEHGNKILFQAITGSHAYGLARAHSDEDIRGIYVLPAHAYLSITPPIKMVSDQRNDVVYYSLGRLMELLAQSNPNIIELLFTPEDCVKFKAPLIEGLFQSRQEFVSMELCDGFIGFAQTQLKKSRGQNKWVNKQQPLSPPKKEDFLWILPNIHKKPFPARPITLEEANLDLTQCHVSSLEHCPHVYRLYHIGTQAKGVFRNEQIVCECITETEEKNQYIGLLIFNKMGFEAASRDFQHYWEWRNNRNEQRWRLQEGQIIDYDPKNMMHMFRLLLSCKQILQTGLPLVRVEGDNKIFLNDVLDGKYPFEELVNISNSKVDELNALKAQTNLRETPNINLINELLYSITLGWEKTGAFCNDR